MKHSINSLSIIVAIFAIVVVQPTWALDLGTEITISDGNFEGTGWYGNQEDEETEPGTIIDQSWDLEGMFLDGNILSLVGGYDFMNGNGERFSGDIFLDVTDDMVYGQDITHVSGNGYHQMNNIFGYDYVIDITEEVSSSFGYDETTLKTTYSVYQIDQSATLLSPYWRNFDESAAYRYVSGGTLVGSGELMYTTGLSAADTGFNGETHNVLSVNLDFLAPETTFTAHYTMGCGNDDLIGSGSTAPVPSGSNAPVPTPEPGTILLLGVGLLGLVGIIRKRLV